MPPTIRIDDEVYAWLKDHAQPFEDTPNSVLRRLFRMDECGQIPKDEKDMTSMVANKQLNGRALNQRWKVGAKHALYHKDGTWYNNLERFPGALFDPNGYVVFNTEKEYRDCKHLQISQETNVMKGISRIPGYIRIN